MKPFNKLLTAVCVVISAVFVCANIALSSASVDDGAPYRVEISRLAQDIENGKAPDTSSCKYVTSVAKQSDGFFDVDSEYAVREINGTLYRFDYEENNGNISMHSIWTVNIFLLVLSAIMLGVLLYVRANIIKPFERLSSVPYELARGNLTPPVREMKSRFFGKFLWGIDILRENIEQQKERELQLQKDKKTLLLSLSHDIKTPLSAIKLYSKALSRGLYTDAEKRLEIAENIDRKADEIESYLSQIVTASREDIISLEVKDGEFYLSELVNNITSYYTEKLSLVKIGLTVGAYSDVLISGDIDKSVEVLQNIIENAVKYGDGENIAISLSQEDGGVLITVSNGGCTLTDDQLPHIFESFWRGANAEGIKGSGLGLYICRSLMRKMNGDIFAGIKNGCISVTTVFRMV